MVKKLTDIIIRTAGLKTLIITILLVIIAEIGFSLLTPEFTRLSGGPLLDMSIWYHADYAYDRLTSFAAAGESYFYIRLIDFFFPPIYACTFSILSAVIYRKKYSNPADYRWIIAAPFLGAFFDYSENILLVILFRSLPGRYPLIAEICNIATLGKFVLISFSILLIITGAFSLLKGSDSSFLHGNKFRGAKKEIKDDK